MKTILKVSPRKNSSLILFSFLLLKPYSYSTIFHILSAYIEAIYCCYFFNSIYVTYIHEYSENSNALIYFDFSDLTFLHLSLTSKSLPFYSMLESSHIISGHLPHFLFFTPINVLIAFTLPSIPSAIYLVQYFASVCIVCLEARSPRASLFFFFRYLSSSLFLARPNYLP